MQSSPPPAQASLPPPPHVAPPSSIPMKRALEDDHTPSVSSPLNPDSKPRPVQREQREKKDSLKKREAAGLVSSPAPPVVKKGGKQKAVAASPTSNSAPSPVRYNHALPRESYHYAVKDALLASHEPEPLFVATASGPVELKRPIDQTENKKVYRYTHCIADPAFPHMRYYRATDDKPYGPRMSFVDSDKWVHFDDSARTVTNEKGWRMSRANVCAREGSFYFEVKILRGVPRDGPAVPAGQAAGPLPHVRVGWSRREAPLDAPIGFDGYSYGLSDIRMEPMHKSRASKFLDNGTPAGAAAAAAMAKKAKAPKAGAKAAAAAASPATAAFAANDDLREGDVVGLLIELPSLALQRKIADGNYNPAVDTGNGFGRTSGAGADDEGAPNIVRDRFPVPYKGAMYFETLEYRSSKGMEGYGDRGPFTKETPGTNHADPTLRCLPHSSIKVFKNGRAVGTAFRDLMAFLPPCSVAEKGKEAKDAFDDGMVGYYPTVALFSGGAAEVNFGPDFWHAPDGLDEETAAAAAAVAMSKSKGGKGGGAVKQEERGEDVAMGGTVDGGGGGGGGVGGGDHGAGWLPPRLRSGIRAVGERYTEQIVEDVMCDLVDEVDFYLQDGGGDAGKASS